MFVALVFKLKEQASMSTKNYWAEVFLHSESMFFIRKKFVRKQ